MTETPKPPEEILDKGQNNDTIADWESLANYDNGDIGREPNCTNYDHMINLKELQYSISMTFSTKEVFYTAIIQER